MKLYRYIASLDDDFKAGVGCAYFNVVRETKSCYVIKYRNKNKFILKEQKGKRFAYTTKEQALFSFGVRSKRRIEILEDHLKQAKSARSVYLKYGEDLLSIKEYEYYN